MATTFTYDLSNPARDVHEIFTDIVKDMPSLMSMIRVGSDFKGADTSGHPKLEWVERQLSPTKYTIASFDTDGDGTGINVNSTAGLSQYDLLVFESSTGQRRSEILQIASVDSSTNLTVTRDYASSTGVTLATGDVGRVLKPTAEGTDATESDYDSPTIAYNYPVISQRAVKISKTALGINTYGKIAELSGAAAEKMADAIQQKMIEIGWEMEWWLINGYKSARTNTTTAKGTAGGLFQFLESGNVNSTGSAVSLDHIQDTLEMIKADGGDIGNLTAVMNTNQARRISAFNTSGTNPIIMLDRSGTVTGNYVTQIQGDLGGVTKMVVDTNMPKDTILIINPEMIEVNYLAGRRMADTDATPTDASDYIMRRLLAEYSFTIKNGTTAHGMITGLTV